MRIFNKKNIIKIASDDLNDAKLSCADFKDENVAKRAFIDVLAARLAMKFLFSKKIEVNNLYSLYTIRNVLEQFDISDIYYDDVKIDVRLVFNREEIFIPKSQFHYGILPDLFAILELKEDLSSAEILGFVEPKNINKANENKDFYFVELDELELPEDVKAYLTDYKGSGNYAKPLSDTECADTLFMSSVDGEITKKDKEFLIQQLAQSYELRERFVEFENFEVLSAKVAQDETLMHDGVLDIIGAQAIYQADQDSLELVDISFNDEESEISFDSDGLSVFEEIDEPVDALSLSDDEEIDLDIDKEHKDEPSDFSKTLANGAVIAGSGIVAGAALAAGAAAMAQGSSAAVSSAVADAAIKAGSSLLEGVVDSLSDVELKPDFSPEVTEDLDDFADSDFLDQLVSDSKEQGFEDEDFLSQFDALTSDNEQEIASQSVLELDEQLLDETSDSPELFDEADVVELGEFQLEVEDLSEITEVAEIEDLEHVEEAFVSLEASDSGSVFELDEIAPLEELPELETFAEVEELQEFSAETVAEFEEPVVVSDEIEEQSQEIELDSEENSFVEAPEFTENTLQDTLEMLESVDSDLDSEEEFDFKFLDEDAQDTFAAAVPSVDSLVEGIDLEEDFIAQAVSEDNLITDATDSEPAKSVEISDFDDLCANEDFLSDDISDIASQVDELLKDVEITDEHKSILAENINLDSFDTEIGDNGHQFSQGFDNIEQKEAADLMPSIDMDDDDLELLTSSITSVPDNEDLMQTFFKKENIDETQELELGERKSNPQDDKKKKALIVASIAGVIWISAVAGTAYKATKQNQAPKLPVVAESQGPMGMDMSASDPSMQGQTSDMSNMGGVPLDQAAQPQAASNRDMGQAVSDAFMSEPVNASISKIAWEVPEELAYNDSFRQYLQNVGRNLKVSLQSDLLLATELAYSNKTVVDLKISKDGSVQSANIVVSSGSKQIDEIVLQSVKDTMKYLKMPSTEVRGGSVDATLIINF